MRLSLLLPCALTACVPALTGDHLCEQVGQAIALRTVACTDDPRLGNRRYEALFEEGRCQAAPEQVEAAVSCTDALLRADCAAVEAEGDDPRWWLEQAPPCDGLFDLDPRPEPSETGATTAPPPGGTCANPQVVDLRGLPLGAPVAVSLYLTPGAESIPLDCAPPPARTDQVLTLLTDRAGLVQVTLTAGPPPAPLRASLLAQGANCQAAVLSCFDLLAGVATPLYPPEERSEEHAFVLHLEPSEPWIASGVVLEFRQEAP